jgi:hypothetical protein
VQRAGWQSAERSASGMALLSAGQQLSTEASSGPGWMLLVRWPADQAWGGRQKRSNVLSSGFGMACGSEQRNAGGVGWCMYVNNNR